MMNIIDQGEWVLYQPVDYPVKDLLPNTMFARRETDGADWYQFRDAYIGKTDSVWMTLLKGGAGWIVLMTTRDITLLFPSSPMEMHLIEVRGLEGDHESFRHMRFDFDKREFLPKSPPPSSPSPMQMMAEELGIDWENLRKRIEAKIEANRS